MKILNSFYEHHSYKIFRNIYDCAAQENVVGAHDKEVENENNLAFLDV